MELKSFFNTSGKIYREQDLKNRLPEMSEDEQLALLATDGMLVKRPLLIAANDAIEGAGTVVLLGFKEESWKETFSIDR